MKTTVLPMLGRCAAVAVLSVVTLTGVTTAPTAEAQHGGAGQVSAQLREGPSDMPRDMSFFNEFGGSAYHLYAKDIDWDEPVGAVYYFGGDYFRRSESEVFHPRRNTMRTLAEEAAARNMLLIVPLTPAERGYEGFTWWEEGDDNAEWFRALHQDITSRYELEPDMIWFMGYSGGAEFVAQEILSDYLPSYGSGGALMVGGGGPPTELASMPTDRRDTLGLMWIVGEEDTTGSTNPPDWSALEAARSGEAFYRKHGFERTVLDVVEDTDHLDYDFDEALDEHFDHFGVPRTDTNAVATAIGWSSFGAAITGGVGGLFAWRHKRKQRRSED